MNILNITNDFVGLVGITQNVYISETTTIQIICDENNNFKINFNFMNSSVPGGVLLVSLIGLILRRTLQLLFSKQLNNGKVFIPFHPV